MRSIVPKFCVVLMVALLWLSTSASGAEDPFTRQISVEWKQAQLKQVLSDLEQETGLRFVSSKTQLAKASPVSIKSVNQPVSQRWDQSWLRGVRRGRFLPRDGLHQPRPQVRRRFLAVDRPGQ